MLALLAMLVPCPGCWVATSRTSQPELAPAAVHWSPGRGSRDSIAAAVRFSATGGTVSARGQFTADRATGTFRVVATEASTGRADTASITIGSAPPARPATVARLSTDVGRPFGLFGLWNSPTSMIWGPGPFTVSQNFTDPTGIVAQITTARAMHQKLVLAMTGGSHNQYLTAGAFDLSKWQARMQLFNTTAIREAIAQGVADGTVVGNSIMDEPEHRTWGGTLTKSVLDEMAEYAKTMFPTLPIGVNHGPNGYYQWRPTERYKVVDYVVNQYNWWVTNGDVVAWRDKVLAQAALDGVTPAFSLNLLDGGTQDKDGTWDCAGTGGRGNHPPNCRMSPGQALEWGSALAPAGCLLLMWKFDDDLMKDSDYQATFKSLAAKMAAEPARTCKRT